MTRLGYQIPNFTYPDTKPAEIFGKVIAQAKAAEAAGYDRVMVMDHFYQLPMLGHPLYHPVRRRHFERRQRRAADDISLALSPLFQ